MAKKYLDKNVYELAQERIKFIFDEFDNVLVSFSGGKDSGVLLNLCYDYAKEHNMLYKLGMVHIDYEAQYQMTTDYVDATFKHFNDIERFWLCLPIHAQCACNMQGGYWIPWEKSKKDIWVRDIPVYDYVINEDNCQFKITAEDYEIPKDFFNWYVKNHKGKTASLIGIRGAESFERYKLVKSETGVLNLKRYKNKKWTCGDDNLYKCYPLYDWETQDIWVYNAKFNKPYNKLYDLFYQAGLSIDQMRVASPFNNCAGASLKLYKVIDPKNWGRMVGRVNGVNFLGLYGDTIAMGWKKITKPKHFTWKEYCYFLLNTLDEKTRQHYLKKLEASKKSWLVGGAMDEETIKQLKEVNAPAIFTGKTNKRSSKGREVVQFNDYLDDIDIKNFARIPTYKRMCICIIKNDYYCKYMGFAQTKEEISKRKKALERYSNL